MALNPRLKPWAGRVVWPLGAFEIHFPRRFMLWLKALQHLNDGLYFRAVRRATGL